jgi:PAS domain S-box-containing protein/putative nucleotidyltransferase with HDIG domain
LKDKKISEDSQSTLKDTYTILVVEKDPGLNRRIQKRLQQEAFLTEEALTGIDAIHKSEEFTKIIVLLDYTLPDVSCEEIIKALKKKRDGIPFVIMNDYGDERIAVKMMKLGARDYIIKNKELIEIISHVLQRVVKEVKREDELLEAERARHISENKYRNLVETTKDLIWQSDIEGRFTFLNKAWEETFGYSIDEMLGRNFTDFQDPEIPEKEKREISEQLRSVSVSGFETTHISKSGEKVQLILNTVPLSDEKGLIIGTQGTAFDITKLKERDREILNSREAFFNMLEDVNEAYKELEILFTSLVRTMISTLDAKSQWTKGHSERVAKFTVMIAENMGFDEDELKRLWLAGILHDIGKIGTYDTLLDKPVQLTEKEFKIVKKHPNQGAKILEGIKQLRDIVPFIRHHHERVDGKGYPDGLKGEEIPMQARIMHVADSYDAMISDRPYRPAPPRDYALSEFDRCKGTKFDPQVIEVFLDILNKDKEKTGN